MADEETETEDALQKGNETALNGGRGDCESRTDDLRPRVTIREKLVRVLHSHKFQLCVIGLVIIDCLLVIADLLLEVHPADANHHDVGRHIPHYLSIAVLSIFLVELAVKLYALRLEFFQHKLEIFDAVIVILSFTLDIVFLYHNTAANASGLLILLRLWRVARILNGVVLSVKTQAEHKLAKERRMREALEQEVFHLKDFIAQLEQRNELLESKLKENGIPVPGVDETTSTDFH